MKHAVIELSVQINASPDNVWRVFTNPDITRQMGGEYVSDWKVGGRFSWKGLDGRFYTNGEIVQIKAAQILKHNLFNKEDSTKVISVITYTLDESNNSTILSAREELTHGIADDEYENTLQGWDAALNAVKVIAEKL